jgi:RHS repeat-associated protein
VVATIHPNQTYEKVMFDPWHQESWDVNDTVLQSDPTKDPDVSDFFTLLPAADYSPTWFALRTDPANSAQAALLWPDPVVRATEVDAANKAAAHANTPTLSYFDSLGRTFLNIADNGGNKFPFRVEFDIQGSQRSVRDGIVQAGDLQGRIVMSFDFDMLKNTIHQSSMEAAHRWMLNDATGKEIRAWDTRGHNFRATYDALRRPIGQFVFGTDAINSDLRTLAAEMLYDKIEYGEGRPPALNLATRVFRHSNSAGTLTNVGYNPVTGQDEAFDFKGNLLRVTRGFIAEYKSLPDLTALPATPDTFSSSTQYDALNRPTSHTTPDGSVAHITYNEATFLETVNVNLRGSTTATSFVTNIEYNAKGQRTLIQFGDGGTQTAYAYDPSTFRVTNITTTRPGAANQQVVQDLYYSYDPIGNITHIQDDADIHNVVFFRNQRVEPSADFTYDPIYRLIQVKGREQLGLGANNKPLSPTATSYNDVPRIFLTPAQGDGNALGTYVEQYQYDAASNFLKFIHQGANPADPGWSRTYSYNEASPLEPAKKSNRLSNTVISGNQPFNEPYSYDLHGNMTSMPQLRTMQWNFKDQMLMTLRQAVNPSDADGTKHSGEETYYVYDSTGQRVRKTTESSGGTRIKERFYLDGFELYREYDSTGTAILARETLHVMDDKKRIALFETKTIDSSAPQGSLPSSATRYQFDNHLGTACLELDETAAVITYEEYYPYGATSYQAGRSLAEVSLKRYRYAGKEKDVETGLNYHDARYYAPWLGKWTSVDPSGLTDGMNLYTYARGNPIRLKDETGNYSWSEFGSDVWSGVKGVAEPLLIVADFGQMGAAMVTKEFFPDSYHDVQWLSATGRHFEQNPDEGIGTRLVHTVVEPEVNIVTGGGYGLAKNIHAAVQTGDPDKARSILVQGAAGQVLATGLASVGSQRSGQGWTGRGNAPESLKNITDAEINRAVNEPGKSNVMVQIPAKSLQPIETSPYGKGQMVKMPTTAKTSAAGGKGDVKTTVRFHDADPTAPRGSVSRKTTTMSIEQAKGARRVVPDPKSPSGGRWVHKNTASDADWGKAHIPIYGDSTGTTPFFPGSPILPAKPIDHPHRNGKTH